MGMSTTTAHTLYTHKESEGAFFPGLAYIVQRAWRKRVGFVSPVTFAPHVGPPS